MSSDVEENEVESEAEMRQDLRPWFVAIEELVTAHPQGLPFSEIFANDHPVEIDVGCGRGLFVHSATRRNPDRNYLGIELDYKEGRRAARRLAKLDSPNGRIFGGDVMQAFRKLFAPQTVSAIHVYFPDPWWKKRHRSRRVFNVAFLERSHELLIPGGYVHSWTDVEEYFGGISALMDHHPDFEKLPAPEERIPENDMDYQTSFERKKRKLGLPIYRGLWRKVR